MKTYYHNQAIIIPAEYASQLIECSEGHKHRIVPIQLTDGRFAVSADVITEKDGVFAYIFEQIPLHEFDPITRDEFLSLLPVSNEDNEADYLARLAELGVEPETDE